MPKIPKEEQMGGVKKESVKKIEPTEAPQAREYTDTSFQSQVKDFFGALVQNATEQAKKEAVDSEDRIQYEKMQDLYRIYAEDLDELSYPGRKKEIVQQNPHLVGEALGSLADFMSRTNIDVGGSRGDKALDDEASQFHQKSKDLFMDSCAKVFPDVKLPPIHRLEAQFKKMSRELSALQNDPLRLLERNVGSLDNIKNLRQGNPKELMDQLDRIIYFFGQQMDSALSLEQTPKKATPKELAAVAKAMYELQLVSDDIRKQVYGREDVTPVEANQIDEQRSKIRVSSTRKDSATDGTRKEERIKELSLDEVERIFSDKSIKTANDIKAVVTPETNAVILYSILHDVDRKIQQAKRFVEKNPGTALEARRMGNVIGMSAGTKREYQFPACAIEGRIIDPEDVGAMRIDEYLKKYLGYDIHTDQNRREDLRKYTNMLNR